MKTTKHKRNLTVVATLVLLVFSVCFLSACSREQVTPKQFAKLYLTEIEYEPVSATIFAIVSMVGVEDQLIEGQTSRREDSQFKDGIWFQTSVTQFTVSNGTLYSAVNAKVTQEDRKQDGIEYTSLKVVFRYDTIYKSIISNGEVKKIGKIFHHSLLIAGLEDSSLNLQRSVPRTANWYAILIACGLLAGAVGVAITLVVKRKRWQKEKDE